MHAVVNDVPANMKPKAEEFLLEHRKQFGAASMDREQIEVESHSHWYNPFTWGEHDTSPNLEEGVTRNRETVWAKLHGSLPIHI